MPCSWRLRYITLVRLDVNEGHIGIVNIFLPAKHPAYPVSHAETGRKESYSLLMQLNASHRLPQLRVHESDGSAHVGAQRVWAAHPYDDAVRVPSAHRALDERLHRLLVIGAVRVELESARKAQVLLRMLVLLHGGAGIMNGDGERDAHCPCLFKHVREFREQG